MKKKILLFLLVPILIYGQDSRPINENPFPIDEHGDINFTFIIENNLAVKVLFRNAKTWITTAVLSTESRTYKPTILMEDSSTGRIVVEFNYNNYIPSKYGSESMSTNSSFKITFDCKDKKYRYKIEDYINILKYGDKEYVTTFNTLHENYENNNNKSFVLDMKKFFIDISTSIQKSMSLDDDF